MSKCSNAEPISALLALTMLEMLATVPADVRRLGLSGDFFMSCTVTSQGINRCQTRYRMIGSPATTPPRRYLRETQNDNRKLELIAQAYEAQVNS